MPNAERYVIAVVLASLVSIAPAFGKSRCDLSSLPRDIQSYVQKEHPGWAIVTSSDLREDDQEIWKTSGEGNCPGFVQGNFEGTVTSLAVTLFKRNPSTHQMLVVLTKKESALSERVLSPDQKVAYLSVISKLPMGGYKSATGGSFRLEHDGVVYEAIEAGSDVYYFSDGKYLSMNLSE